VNLPPPAPGWSQAPINEWRKLELSAYTFARLLQGRDQVYTLDILLDIEKLYPLISRPQAEGGNVSSESFFPE